VKTTNYNIQQIFTTWLMISDCQVRFLLNVWNNLLPFFREGDLISKVSWKRV